MLVSEYNRQQFRDICDEVVSGIRTENGVGTLQEKTIHAVLKNYYEPDEDKQEIPIENYVADIYSDGEIIEIQTRNFDKMREMGCEYLFSAALCGAGRDYCGFSFAKSR